MIPDSRIRETLDKILQNYSFEVELKGPFHKIYRSNGLVVLEEVITGTKMSGYETSEENLNKRYLRDSDQKGVLVTHEEAREYAVATTETKRFDKRKKDPTWSVVTLDPKTKVPVVIDGPLVESHDDTNLETANAKRILVRYDGINLHKEYFDAPWWQALIKGACEQYHVEIASPERGVPKSMELYPERSGLTLPYHPRPREKLVFRLEASEEADVEKTIKNVWYVGHAVERAMKDEEERLMAYLE